MKKGLVFVVVVFLFGFSAVAMADVLPISQPSSVLMFPIRITQPGSCKLVTNIRVPNANTTAILVRANNVTIDLNGFSILGPAVCSNTPPQCTPYGTGDGINSSTFQAQNTKIRNGTIQGMGNNGINLTSGSVEAVRAIGNGGSGIVIGTGTVSNSSSTNNSGSGIHLFDGSVRSCTASGNALDGIYLRTGTVSDSTSTDNFDDGILVGGGGIVINNKSANNNAYGLDLGPSVGYASNSLFNNSIGNVTGGVELGNNVCDTALCP